MKGQSTIEFLGSMIIFILVLISSLSIITGRVPDFRNDLKQSSHNMEAYRFTNYVMSKPGSHSYNNGGANWERTDETVSEIEEFGLAEGYHILDKDKIEALNTSSSLKSDLNYSQFREITDLENQYYFEFTWFPIVETESSFTRTEPPFNPPIDEPETSPPNYNFAENRVHYGSFRLADKDYNFLVAAFDGVYNTTYLAEKPGNWNFTNSEPKGVGDTLKLDSRKFNIKKIQNRDRKPGSSVILERNLNSFGQNPENVGSPVTKLNRYAVLKADKTDKEVIRMEVLSW
jgi:hypothetical protein